MTPSPPSPTRRVASTVPAHRTATAVLLALLLGSGGCGDPVFTVEPNEMPLTVLSAGALQVGPRLPGPVRDLEVTADGTAWILSEGATRLLRVPLPSGPVVPASAPLRSGPGRPPAFSREPRPAGTEVPSGELGRPVQLVVVPGSSAPVRVWDLAVDSLLALDPEGRRIGGVPFERRPYDVPVTDGLHLRTHADPYRLEAREGALYYVWYRGGLAGAGELRSGLLVRLDTASLRTGSGSVAPPPGDDRRADPAPVEDGPQKLVDFRGFHPAGADAASRRFGRQLTGVPLWAVCPDGRLAVHDPIGSRLLVVADGGIERLYRLPPLPELTEEAIRRYLAYRIRAMSGSRSLSEEELRDRVEVAYQLDPGRFGHPAPGYVGLLCDDRGGIWLQPWAEGPDPLGRGSEWWVLDEEGDRRIRFPEGFRLRSVRGGLAVGALESAPEKPGGPSLAWIRMPPVR